MNKIFSLLLANMMQKLTVCIIMVKTLASFYRFGSYQTDFLGPIFLASPSAGAEPLLTVK